MVRTRSFLSAAGESSNTSQTLALSPLIRDTQPIGKKRRGKRRGTILPHGKAIIHTAGMAWSADLTHTLFRRTRTQGSTMGVFVVDELAMARERDEVSARSFPMFITPKAPSRIGSELPEKHKIALLRVDGKSCAVTNEMGPMIQVCHLMPKTTTDRTLKQLRQRGVVLNVHSRANLISLDATLHGSFDRFEWTIVPTSGSLENLRTYSKGTDPTFYGLHSSAEVEDPHCWWDYELATFDAFERPIVIRLKNALHGMSEHERFRFFVANPQLGSRSDTQSHYRDEHGNILPTFRHHAHPYIVTLAAWARYQTNKETLSISQQARMRELRDTLSLWDQRIHGIPRGVPAHDSDVDSINSDGETKHPVVGRAVTSPVRAGDEGALRESDESSLTPAPESPTPRSSGGKTKPVVRGSGAHNMGSSQVDRDQPGRGAARPRMATATPQPYSLRDRSRAAISRVDPGIKKNNKMSRNRLSPESSEERLDTAAFLELMYREQVGIMQRHHDGCDSSISEELPDEEQQRIALADARTAAANVKHWLGELGHDIQEWHDPEAPLSDESAPCGSEEEVVASPRRTIN
ncbi:hypothetical protein CALVIDRAFT_602617 [Calocera viscosa TUFC12733]|uniref:HNH nuclease domain-containing protein n=1 Tax=Calocera viscosa (strain TUFC12733) TaxID=1330018 RepID=A0A167GU72_CALVF|nr:hypothetical protein CALVIDRAFT_602617 [Calocera viscosa TUFC12733]